jgi:tRNA:m4X modification enzyme
MTDGNERPALSKPKGKSKRKKDVGDREGKCTFYNEKKQRFCNQEISKRLPYPFSLETDFKPIYCGNHGSMYSNLLKDRKRQKVKHDDAKGGRRIPCPIDPSHTIYEHNLKSHIKKCPKARIANEERQRKYYKHNINTGGSGEENFNPVKEGGGDVPIDPKDFAIRILNAYRDTFLKGKEKEECDVTSLTAEKMYQCIPVQNNFHSEKKLGLESNITKHRVKIGGPKHMEQIGSLVGHARANNLLQSADTVLEMGAGRATTGFVMSGVCAAAKGEKVKLVLVEKCGSRSKADSALKRTKVEGEDGNGTEEKEYFRLDDVDVNRIKCDLSHVSIPEALDEAQEASTPVEGKPISSQQNDPDENRNILVIAKHLCGAGTDLALKSIMPIKHLVSGYVLATCCHGLCSWEHYVGRDFLGKVMSTRTRTTIEGKESQPSFGEKEFNLMKRWACGTTIGAQREKQAKVAGKANTEADPENEHSTPYDDDTGDLSVSKISSLLGLKCGPQGLGRACQRLIDYGRCDYLKKKLFDESNGVVNLSHYVDPSVTPQNAMIFGQAT